MKPEVRDCILSHKYLKYPTKQVVGFREKLQEKERLGLYKSWQGLRGGKSLAETKDEQRK